MWVRHEIKIKFSYRRKKDEVQILEETIRARNEQHKKAGIELDATCHICLKTKFADGVGHLCNYCSIRCCARCGGKVTLRSNKVCYFLDQVLCKFCPYDVVINFDFAFVYINVDYTDLPREKNHCTHCSVKKTRREESWRLFADSANGGVKWRSERTL